MPETAWTWISWWPSRWLSSAGGPVPWSAWSDSPPAILAHGALLKPKHTFLSTCWKPNLTLKPTHVLLSDGWTKLHLTLKTKLRFLNVSHSLAGIIYEYTLLWNWNTVCSSGSLKSYPKPKLYLWVPVRPSHTLLWYQKNCSILSIGPSNLYFTNNT